MGGVPLVGDYTEKKSLKTNTFWGHVGITQIRVLFWVLKCEKKGFTGRLVLSTQEASVQRRAVGFRGTAFFKYPRGVTEASVLRTAVAVLGVP